MDHSAPSVSGGWGGGRQTQNALSHSPGHVDLVYQPCLSTLFTRDLMHTLLSRRHIPFFILYPVDQFSTPIQLFVTSNPLLLLFFFQRRTDGGGRQLDVPQLPHNQRQQNGTYLSIFSFHSISPLVARPLESRLTTCGYKM